MAQPISFIQNQILAQIAANPTLSPLLTSPSQVAIFRLMTYIIAFAINLFQQLNDVFLGQVQTLVAQAIPNTATWLRVNVLAFQYSATTPQVVQFNNYAPAYPNVNTAYQILGECDISTVANVNKQVLINVSKKDGTLLATGEAAALNAYLPQIMPPGLTYVLRNAYPDYILVGGIVYYNGQYSGTIATTVQAAILAYLAGLPYAGTVVISALEAAILAVPGVEDFEFNWVEARPYASSPSGAAQIIEPNGGDPIQYARTYQPYAGTLIIDTATGRTLNDTLSYVVQ